MNEKTKYHLADLEYAISVHLRPSFLSIICVEENPDEITIVVSAPQFRNMPIQKRVATVFNLISRYCYGTIGEYLILVTVLDSNEMEDFLGTMIDEELE